MLRPRRTTPRAPFQRRRASNAVDPIATLRRVAAYEAQNRATGARDTVDVHPRDGGGVTARLTPRQRRRVRRKAAHIAARDLHSRT